MKLSDKTYDLLKWLVMYLFPGLGALYFGLSKLWGFPYGDVVVGSITALTTFLGLLLGFSSVQYLEKIYKSETPPSDPDPSTTFIWRMPDEVYQVFKWSILMFLPAFGTLYTTLAKLYSWGWSEEVMGSIALLTVFLSIILKVAKSNKYSV